MSYRTKIVTAVLVVATWTGLAFSALAQGSDSSVQPPAAVVQSLTAAFERFTEDGRAVYDVSIALSPRLKAAGDIARYIVALDDHVASILDPVCAACSRTINAVADGQRFQLTSAWFHQGPLVLEVREEQSRALLASIGPLQLPVRSSRIRPYGAVGLGANELHLHAYGSAEVGGSAKLLLYGTGSAQSALFGVGLRPDRRAMLGGTLLIEPLQVVQLAIIGSDASTPMAVEFRPWMIGTNIYLQAATVGTDAQGVQAVRWSNGIEMEVVDPTTGIGG